MHISPFLAASAICPTLYQDTQLQKLQSLANINKKKRTKHNPPWYAFRVFVLVTANINKNTQAVFNQG